MSLVCDLSASLMRDSIWDRGCCPLLSLWTVWIAACESETRAIMSESSSSRAKAMASLSPSATEHEGRRMHTFNSNSKRHIQTPRYASTNK